MGIVGFALRSLTPVEIVISAGCKAYGDKTS